MKRLHVRSTVTTLIIALSAAAHATPATPLRDFLDVRISPDGRSVVSVEGDSNPAGGAPVVRELVIRSSDGKSLTTVALPCGRVAQCWPSSPAWTPDSTKLTFALRTPGSHARTLYQVDADGSHLMQLLAFNGTIGSLMYNAKGHLAMLATADATKETGAVEAGAPASGELDAAPPEQRIAVLKDGKLEWMSPADMFVYEYDWRPDGKGFVGTAAHGDGDNNWWIAKLYAFKDGKADLIYTPANAQQQLAMPRVSRDGKRVAFIAGLMSDFGSTGGDIYTLALSDKSGGTAPGAGALDITPKMPSSAGAIAWDCDNQLVARLITGDRVQTARFGDGTAAAEAKVFWQRHESLSGSAALTPACPSGMGARLHEGFAQAAEIEVGSGSDWHDLTHANAAQRAPFHTQSLNWLNEGLMVQGWLLLPETIEADKKANKKLPLVVVVHGGPASAYTPRFIGPGTTRELLERGYAVLEPNPRGSFGQGEAFTQANVRDFGYGDLRDIMVGVQAASGAAPIDPARVGIMGHSYGGFMTMWAVTQTHFFKAAVASAGIANWQSYYGENGIDQWMIPYFGASVYEDPAIYARSSAINYIKNVRTPTLSLVGAADIECPAPQTQEFNHAMKTYGLPSTAVIYPGEGHRFVNPEHLADREKRILEWFDRYLK